MIMDEQKATEASKRISDMTECFEQSQTIQYSRTSDKLSSSSNGPEELLAYFADDDVERYVVFSLCQLLSHLGTPESDSDYPPSPLYSVPYGTTKELGFSQVPS
ncbi:hypothetical protein ABKN59_009277 [Abortiporus biennis]